MIKVIFEAMVIIDLRDLTIKEGTVLYHEIILSKCHISGKQFAHELKKQAGKQASHLEREVSERVKLCEMEKDNQICKCQTYMSIFTANISNLIKQIYLPAFVIIISVPCWLNLCHNSLFSNWTSTFWSAGSSNCKWQPYGADGG